METKYSNSYYYVIASQCNTGITRRVRKQKTAQAKNSYCRRNDYYVQAARTMKEKLSVLRLKLNSRSTTHNVIGRLEILGSTNND